MIELTALREMVMAAESRIGKSIEADDSPEKRLIIRLWILIARLGLLRLRVIGAPNEAKIVKGIQQSARGLLDRSLVPALESGTALDYEEILTEANLLADAARELIRSESRKRLNFRKFRPRTR